MAKTIYFGGYVIIFQKAKKHERLGHLSKISIKRNETYQFALVRHLDICLLFLQ